MSSDSDRNALVRAAGAPTSTTDQAIAAAARILDSISDAFVFVDREWRYVYVNARAAEFFGREPQRASRCNRGRDPT